MEIARSGRDLPTCPPPLLDEDLFPDTGGFVSGRWCRDIPLASGQVSCCLPCPGASWLYAGDFDEKLKVASWCALVVLVTTVATLVTYMVLPANITSRHYLTTTPLVGFILLCVAYIIPLWHSPNLCYNEITPNDNYSDSMCAVTGVLVISGSWVVMFSCLFRSFSLYLVVFWERNLGKKYMYTSLLCIAVGSTTFLLLAFYLSGCSYQLGKVCYIKSKGSLATFWAPLLVVALLTFIFQTWTVVYCVYIVLRQIWRDRPGLYHSEQPRSSFEYRHRVIARRASLRVRDILRMQWRPIIIVFIILFHVSFLAFVFLQMDRIYDYSSERLLPWITCLISLGVKDRCSTYASGLGPDENVVVAAIVLLAVCGIWGFILSVRPSMISAWMEVFNWNRGHSPLGSDKATTSTEQQSVPETITQRCVSASTLSPSHDCELSWSTKDRFPSTNQPTESQFNQHHVVSDWDFPFPTPQKACFSPPQI